MAHDSVRGYRPGSFHLVGRTATFGQTCKCGEKKPADRPWCAMCSPYVANMPHIKASGVSVKKWFEEAPRQR